MKQFTVMVDLALTRPVGIHRTSQVIIMADSAMQAELMAISMASCIHNAEMPVGSKIVKVQ